MNWNLILKYFLEYWREILSIVCLIISVVFYIIKRKPSFNLIDAIKEDVLEKLPVLINSVERDGNGQLKKATVVEIIRKYVGHHYNFDLTPYLGWLDECIEFILSTPQKKKGNYNER